MLTPHRASGGHSLSTSCSRNRLSAFSSLGRRLLAQVLLVAGPGVAAAQDEGLPIDLELLRPGLSPQGGFGVDAPHPGGRGIWSAGALLQYENSPLRLYDGDSLLGQIVGHRIVAQLHAGVGVSKRTSFSLMVPVAGHFGSDEVDYARDGGGLGDLAVSMRVLTTTYRKFTLGALGTVLLPTGNRKQYMGERLPRLRAGLLGYTDLGRFDVLTNLLIHLRDPVDTGFDFVAGSELQVELGLKVELLPDQLELLAELGTRLGISAGPAGGRLASELVAGVRYRPGPGGLRIDLGLGRGLTEGYGTTGVRAMVGLTYVRPVKEEPPPPEPEPEPPLLIEEEELPEEDDPPPPPPPPPPPKVAELTGEEIVIRDPIEFELDTTVLLPSSEAVLDAVADVILGNGAVGHVVIEGHASQEGGFAYNYRLSLERARAVYEALILRGVHPKRMSYRGAGEVERVVEGEDADAMARNRRVVFNVVRQYAPGEVVPAYGSEVLLPWSGEPHTTTAPPPVEAVQPEQPPVEPVEPPVEAPVEPAEPDEPPDFDDPRYDEPEEEP